MSLKFGIYLVEQRIISPEQFCGLVKIQQEASMSLASIAIRKNFLTIKQVSRVLDLMDGSPTQTFLQIAIEEELIDSSDADRMLHEQQMSCPTLQKLLVECGLLTQRQTEVLFHHFGKQTTQKSKPVTQTAETESTAPKVGPRRPKFNQRATTVVQPFSSQLQ